MPHGLAAQQSGNCRTAADEARLGPWLHTQLRKPPG
jgi:hypothetical protein